jgi:quinol monooxygenase YgiN
MQMCLRQECRMPFPTVHAPRHFWKLALFGTSLLTLMLCRTALAQLVPTPLVRFAELDIEQARLDAFRKAARENAEASLLEPGILAFHAAAEKDNPGHVRVLEMYVDAQAYRAHVQTPHFQKFRAETDAMVLRRELHEVVPVRLAAKASLNRQPLVRVAELTIDPAQLHAYKDAVTEEIATSIRIEPGVLGIYAVALKEQPTQLRFFEIYADDAAYREHIDSPHFKKYIEATKSMIASRKLMEAEPIILGLPSR